MMNLPFLESFVRTYLKRYEVFPLHFEMEKGAFQFAGKTVNDNRFRQGVDSVDIGPMLREMGVDDHISIGGDFVIGYDYAKLTGHEELIHDVALSIFDTANHGFDALFLSSHIRTMFLSILDRHLRLDRDIQPMIFEEFNQMMQGPITRDLLDNTNPVRTLSKGAVGIHGQFHTLTSEFNFLCAGLPLFYYSSQYETFYFLDPDKGPPLGYLSPEAHYRKRYVPHSLKLLPGDYLILATDGCFETELSPEEVPKRLRSKNPVRHFRYKNNPSFDVMYSFYPQVAALTMERMPTLEDEGVDLFCHLLEPHVAAKKSPSEIVHLVLADLAKQNYIRHDDASLIVIFCNS